MKTKTVQNQYQANQVKMPQAAPDMWLQLLGDKSQISRSTGSHRNGSQVKLQVLAVQPKMMDFTPDQWLHLLGGAGQSSPFPTNGNGASPVPEVPQAQRFTAESWLRLLGRGSSQAN